MILTMIEVIDSTYIITYIMSIRKKCAIRRLKYSHMTGFEECHWL